MPTSEEIQETARKKLVPKCCFVELMEAQRHSVVIRATNDMHSIPKMAESFLLNEDFEKEKVDENVVE